MSQLFSIVLLLQHLIFRSELAIADAVWKVIGIHHVHLHHDCQKRQPAATRRSTQRLLNSNLGFEHFQPISNTSRLRHSCDPMEDIDHRFRVSECFCSVRDA